MAMDADGGAISERFNDAADQRSVILGSGVADGIRNVDRAGAGGDYGLGYFLQEIGVSAGSIFGGELDVVHVAAGKLDGGHGFFEDLILRLLEFVLEVNVAGG